MTRDDIIRMVNKAGGGQLSDRQFQLHGLDTITNFAALVASAEREACADLCEQHGYDHYCGNVTDKLAETIRARGDKHD